MTLNDKKTILIDNEAKEHDIAWLIRDKLGLNRQLIDGGLTQDQITSINTRIGNIQSLLDEAKSLGAKVDEWENKFNHA